MIKSKTKALSFLNQKFVAIIYNKEEEQILAHNEMEILNKRCIVSYTKSLKKSTKRLQHLLVDQKRQLVYFVSR